MLNSGICYGYILHLETQVLFYLHACALKFLFLPFIIVFPLPTPSSPTIVSTTPQSTSITITWTQPGGDVVDSYEITYSYQGPCLNAVPPLTTDRVNESTIREDTV